MVHMYICPTQQRPGELWLVTSQIGPQVWWTYTLLPWQLDQPPSPVHVVHVVTSQVMHTAHKNTLIMLAHGVTVKLINKGYVYSPTSSKPYTSNCIAENFQGRNISWIEDKYDFRKENFRGLLTFAAPKDTTSLNFQWRKLSRIATKPLNLWKFSPSKVSHYNIMVY